MIEDDRHSRAGRTCPTIVEVRADLGRLRDCDEAFWDMAFNATLVASAPGSRAGVDTPCGPASRPTVA